MVFRPMVAFVIIARRTLKVSLSDILIIAKMTTEEKPQGPSNPHCFALLFKEANKQYALKRTEDGRVTIEVRNCIILLI